MRRLENDWPHTREDILTRDKGICCDCGKEAWIVHHLSYNMFKGEKTPASKLLSLCPACHRTYHSYPYQGHSGNTEIPSEPMITIKTKDLLTFTEAAFILKVSRPTLYSWIKKQRLHPVLIGRNRYLLREEVENYATLPQMRQHR